MRAQSPDAEGAGEDRVAWLSASWRALQEAPEGSEWGLLERAFRMVFPLRTEDGHYELCYREHALERPRYGERECRERGLTWAAPLKGTFDLLLYDDRGSIDNIFQQEVYLGELPLDTPRGTVLLDGAEHVLLPRRVRAPGPRLAEGAFVDSEDGATLRLRALGKGFGVTVQAPAWMPEQGLLREGRFGWEDELADAAALAPWAEQCLALDGFVLGRLGRQRMNLATGLGVEESVEWLQPLELVALAERLREGTLEVAPRSLVLGPGEQLAQRFRGGVVRLAKAALARLEKARKRKNAYLMPHDVLEASQLSRAVRSLFETKTHCVPLEDAHAASVLEHLERVASEPDAEALPLVSGPPPAQSARLSRGAEVPWREVLPAQGGAPPEDAGELEKTLATRVGEALRAPAPGRVLLAEPAAVVLLLDAGGYAVLQPPLELARAGCLRALRFLAREGAAVRAGELLVAAAGASEQGALALGRTLRARAVPGLSGAVLSERVAREGGLAAHSGARFECALRDTVHGKQQLRREGGEEERLHALDAWGVARPGAAVGPGDVLVARDEAAGSPVPPTPLRVPEGLRGVVRAREVLLRAGASASDAALAGLEAERTEQRRGVARRLREALARATDPNGTREELAQLEELAGEWEYQAERRDELPPGVVALLRVVVSTEWPAGEGSVLADRHGLRVTVERVAPEAELGGAELLLPEERCAEGTRRELAAGGLYVLRLRGPLEAATWGLTDALRADLTPGVTRGTERPSPKGERGTRSGK